MAYWLKKKDTGARQLWVQIQVLELTVLSLDEVLRLNALLCVKYLAWVLAFGKHIYMYNNARFTK